MSREIKKRIQRVVLVAALFVCSGLLYAVIVKLLGRGIPCVFHEITGLRCPGCGIPHAMTALLSLDFNAFIQANLFAPLIIIFFITAFASTSLKYIKTGIYRLSAVNTFVEVSFLILFIVWGIARNFIQC